MPRLRKDWLLVFGLLVLTYAYFYQDAGVNGNSRLGLTFAIVREGRLTMDSFCNNDAYGLNTRDKAVYQGHCYTDKPIGSSLIAALPYAPLYALMRLSGNELPLWLQKYLLTVLTIGLPSAFAGSLVYLFGCAVSRSRWRAFLVTLAICLGTMAFPFSVIFFGHQLSAALLWIAFFFIFRLKQEPRRPAGRLETFGIGLLLGLALLTDFTTAVVVAPLVAYYFYALWARRDLGRAPLWVSPALGGLIPLLLLVGYNLAVYGQPFASGYQYLSNPYFQEAMSQGLMGIGRPHPKVLFYETIHPAQGLLWQSPVLLLALVGGIIMLREKKYRLELALSAFACAAYLLLNAGYFMWWGGDSFGPRQIVPMLPFLSIPLIFVPRRFDVLFLPLTLVSIFQMGVVAASKVTVPGDMLTQITRLGYFEYSTIYSYCLPQLLGGHFAWNLSRAWLGRSGYSLLPLVVLLVGASGWMAWMERALPPLGTD